MQELSLSNEWRQFGPVILPFLIRCGVAALCGAMVGLERELKQKPAGFRTNILNIASARRCTWRSACS